MKIRTIKSITPVSQPLFLLRKLAEGTHHRTTVLALAIQEESCDCVAELQCDCGTEREIQPVVGPELLVVDKFSCCGVFTEAEAAEHETKCEWKL